MTMGCSIRQVEGVTIMDLTGRLSLGEALEFAPERQEKDDGAGTAED